jgi:hypothetical protein
MKALALVLALVQLLSTSAADAATYHVRADGDDDDPRVHDRHGRADPDAPLLALAALLCFARRARRARRRAS